MVANVVLVGLMISAWIWFGWWTIGFPKRRVRIGGITLLFALGLAPFSVVQLGEQAGMRGIQFGLIGLVGCLGGAFFFLTLGVMGRKRRIRKRRTLTDDPDLF